MNGLSQFPKPWVVYYNSTHKQTAQTIISVRMFIKLQYYDYKIVRKTKRRLDKRSFTYFYPKVNLTSGSAQLSLNPKLLQE